MGDLVRTIIVDSTVVARMRRDKVIDNSNIQAGDVLVRLSFRKLHMKNTTENGVEWSYFC